MSQRNVLWSPPFVRALALSVALGTGAVACGGESGGPKAARLRIDPGTVTVDVSGSAQMVATAVDAEGNAIANTNPNIEWRSLAPGIVSIDQGGMLTGIAAGTATIEALAGSLAGTAQVTVNRPPPAELTIDPSTLSLSRGDTGTLTARPATSAGVPVTDAVVTWSSLAPEVATVSATGTNGTGATVTAISPGSAVIRATSEGISSEITVFVSPDPEVALSNTTVDLTIARTSPETIERTVEVSNAGGGTLSGLSTSVEYPDGGVGGWLTASISATAQPATLTLRATAGSLGEGSYQAIVHVLSSLPSVASKLVTVNLVVGPGPVIAVSSATIGFTSFAGGAPPPAQSVTVSNSGGGALTGLSVGTIDWGPVTWGTVSLSGPAAPVALTVTPTAAASQLPPGRYAIDIPVSSTLPRVAPLVVTATLSVDPSPVIALTPATVSFTAALNGATPPPQVVTIGNTGGGTHTGIALGTITYTGGAANWLTATLQNAASAAPTLQLTANAAGVPIGSYVAVIPVRSANPFVAERQLDVTLNVGAAQVITIATPSLALTVQQGGASPPARVIAVSNGGTGTLTGLSVDPVSYTGGANGWMSATLQGANAPTNLSLGFNTAALAVGGYTASVVLRSSIPGALPATLSVTLTVQSGAVIAVTPSPVAFQRLSGGSDPAAAVVTVSNGGVGALTGLSLGTTSYGPGQPSGWLTATLSTANAPATVTLTPASSALTPGNYSATVPVRSSLVGVAETAIAVTLQVNAATTMALSSGNVTLNAPNGGGNPTSATISVTNTGASPLTGLATSIAYTGSAPTNWLTATLSTIVAPATLTLAANVATLPSGSYTATVAVSSPVALNSPRTVNVTLTVPPPIVALSAAATSVSINQSVGSVVVSFAPASVSISNGGGGQLTGITRAVTYNQGSGWLNTSLSGGTAPSLLNFSVNTAAAAGLARGTYTATVAVSAPGSATAFVTVTLRALLTYNTHVASLWSSGPVVPTQQCTNSGCHSIATAAGGLDLVTNSGANTVYARLLSRTGSGGVRLVLPNQPLQSLLYTRTASTTNPMPTGGRVAAIYTTIFNWITDGARQ